MSATSIQAPVGGFNSYDSLDDMPPEDAAIMVNWIPMAGYVRSRGGTIAYRDTGGSNIGKIVDFEYDGGDVFVCCVDDKILDITTATPVTIGSGFTSPRWETVIFNNKLLFVNGADAPQEYDGTTLAAIALTGPVPTSLNGLNVFKGRVYYWENNSSTFWYAAAGGYAGTLTAFDLSLVARRGGVITTMFTFSFDSGDGMDDFAVFLMSTGEALVYQGDDPGDATAWALVGKYKMGEPIDVRGKVSIAGDEIVLTRSGWQSFKTIMQVGETIDNPLVRKISRQSEQDAAAYGSNEDWDAIFFPAGPYILINIPVVDGKQYKQHLMNTQTAAWTTIEGWNGSTFGLLDRQLVFGGTDGVVYVADIGPSDNGDEIQTDCLPAFNYLGSRARNKQMGGVRVITTSSEPDRVSIRAAADYDVPRRPPVAPSSKTPALTPWGSPWGSPWETGSDSELGRGRGVWKNRTAFGYALSYRLATSSNYEEILWLSSQIMFKNAGVI